MVCSCPPVADVFDCGALPADDSLCGKVSSTESRYVDNSEGGKISTAAFKDCNNW